MRRDGGPLSRLIAIITERDGAYDELRKQINNNGLNAPTKLM
jgi:hypothetical protein